MCGIEGISERLGWKMLGLLLGQGWAAKNKGGKGGIKREKSKIVKEKIEVKKRKEKGKEEKPKIKI